MRLFADFYDADVIVASPLALATLLADSNADAQAGAADFLSSIEICVVDRADVMLMQNWAHVLTGAHAASLHAFLPRAPCLHALLQAFMRHLHTARLHFFAQALCLLLNILPDWRACEPDTWGWCGCQSLRR